MVLNSTGTTTPTNSVTVVARRWNFSSSGAMTWEGSTTNIIVSGDGSAAEGALTTGSYGAGASVDNTTNAYIGGTFECKVDFTTAGGTPNGPFVFYLQRSPDNSTWPDNGNGTIVAVLNPTTKGAYTTVVEI